MLLLTDHTARWTSLRKLSVPARGLRMTNVVTRVTSSSPARYGLSPADGQYTVVGGGSCTPLSYTSSTTPMTSRQGAVVSVCTRLPSAADAVPHVSRARFSDTMMTGRRSERSVHVK